jgi:hypothetical protein
VGWLLVVVTVGWLLLLLRLQLPDRLFRRSQHVGVGVGDDVDGGRDLFLLGQGSHFDR